MNKIVNGRDAIDAAHDAAAGHGLDGGAILRLIGTKIGPGFHHKRSDQAIGIKPQLGLGHHGAAMGIGLEGVAALPGPFHWLAKLFGGVEDERIFGIDEGFHAETAADIAGDDLHLVGRGFQDRPGQHGAHPGDALAAGGQGEHAGLRIIFAQRGAYFHAGWGDAVLHDAQGSDMC